MNKDSKEKWGTPHAGAFRRCAVLARIVFVATGLIAVQPTFAQSNIDGAVYGKVTDPKGTVLVEGVSTGLKRTVTPAADGSYRVGSLPPGPYKVTYTPTSGSKISDEINVTVGSNTLVVLDPEAPVKLEKFTVVGAAINPIDFSKTTPSIVLSKSAIDTLPIARTFAAVGLLTPGTVQADTQFNLIGVGRIATFGGNSASENAYYVNGFNLTNFRNGLGGSNVPFDFYDQFEVIDGGYPAQYGRATGGVINATTKRGTNEYHAEANGIYRPNGWKSPTVYFVDGATGRSEIVTYRGLDSTETKQGNLFVSGPIIKDKLFIAGLVNRTNTTTEATVNSGTQYQLSKVNNPFYALKVDTEPFSGQHLEYTFFSDKEVTNRSNYTFDPTTKTIGTTAVATPIYTRGGKNHIFGYTGVFFEDFTLSAVYGEGKFDRTNSSPQDALPYVQDARGPLASAPKTIQGVVSRIAALDQRKAKRVDLEYAFNLLGAHRFRLGYDAESNNSIDSTEYGGGQRFRYVSTAPGRRVLGVLVPDGVTELIFKRIFKTGGAFQVDSDAFYIEDHWSLFHERVALDLGYRIETFENFNAEGKSFIKVANQKSPRLGIAYDLLGDKKTKVSAHFGRYFLPVASNTNIRLAGAQLDDQFYYLPGTGTNPDGSPALGAEFAHSLVSPGTVPNTTSVVDKNLTPMYQDEYIIGVQHELNRKWNVSLKGIYRNLGSSFDDAIVDQGLTAYARAHNLPDQTDVFQYVLINPGKPVTINWDFGDGVSRQVVLSNADLGYPNAVRKYYSTELALERVWDGKWSARFSYVWSHSFGNTEGLVLSDNGQDDAGITLQFDTPDLTHNTYGDLPNDRRHAFKVWGAYAVTSELTVGVSTSLTSGKPINRIGALAAGDSVADFYGASYLLTPRGSEGRTAWIFTGDVSLIYQPKWGVVSKVKSSIELKVFNVLNRHGYTAVDEYATTDEGATSYRYRAPTDFQQARFAQLEVKLMF